MPLRRTGSGWMDSFCLRRLAKLLRELLQQRVELGVALRLPLLDQLAQAVGAGGHELVADRESGASEASLGGTTSPIAAWALTISPPPPRP